MASRIVITDFTRPTRMNTDVSPKARFVADFLSIKDRSSFSDIAEKAVLAVGETEGNRGWEKYWADADENPLVATLLMLLDNNGLPLNHEQQAVRNFVRAHEVFFFGREGKKLAPKMRNVDVLWPHLVNLVLPKHYEKSKATDSWATGEKMCDLLKKAGLKPPAWGPGHA